MANWYGTCRSNYFKVKDLEAFLTMLSKYGVTHITEGEELHGFIANGDGYVPEYWDQETDEQFYIIDEIAAHLEVNEVCIVIEAGAEKACYITGAAYAISWTDERHTITLNDIYAEAQEEFGGDASITEVIY